MINIKIDKFEGPLGLLLNMIEKEKLDIAEISLAKVADQYVEYVNNSEDDIDPELVADFLVIAAKLLYIKSKTLLPYLFPEEEDCGEDLEKQLKMYREFLRAGEKLEEILKERRFMFFPLNNLSDRSRDFDDLFIFSPPKKLKKEDLKSVFEDFINRRRPKEEILREETIEHKINIEDKILSIEKTLMEKMSCDFSKILTSSGSRTELIVSFLALLELIKKRTVIAEQSGLFSDITLNKK